jgi:hypothetical protein
MVICPIARAVHCTGCPFLRFCPVKKILGDYGKVDATPADKAEQQKSDEKLDESNSSSK